MKITVKLFGPHKEKLKKDSIFLSLSDNSNISDLILNLNQFEPGFKENIKSLNHSTILQTDWLLNLKRLYDLTIIAEAFKPMTRVERHKEIYKVLDIMNNPGIHGIKIKASSPEEWKK